MSYFPPRATAVEVAKALKDQISGKNVLITGVSPKSIGEETVQAIAPYAKTIVAASRSVERINEALKAVYEEYPHLVVKTVSLDLLSEKSIRTAATEILNFGLPLDVVINNAAVTQYTTLNRTEQGFEAQIGANHLGHFLFNSLIFPAIRAAVKVNGSARIVPVGSLASWWKGDIRINDLNYHLRPEEYEKMPAYAKSKTANILFAREFARRFKNDKILAISLHPGASDDEWRALGLLNPDGTPISEDAFKNIAQGTSTTIVAAFHPDLASQNGAFLNDNGLGEAKLPAWAKDDDTAGKLWELSESLWKIKFGEVSN